MATDYLIPLLSSPLPTLRDSSGGLRSEGFEIASDTVSLALEAIAGVTLSIVGTESLLATLKADPLWCVLGVFIADGPFPYDSIDRSARLYGRDLADSTVTGFFPMHTEVRPAWLSSDSAAMLRSPPLIAISRG